MYYLRPENDLGNFHVHNTTFLASKASCKHKNTVEALLAPWMPQFITSLEKEWRISRLPGKRILVKRISIEHAKAGQVLAQKIQRADGVLLAGQGTEVTDGLLRMLARMNIDSVVIEDDNTLSPEELEEIYQNKVAELDARFVRVAGNPISASLKCALIEHARNIRDEALAAIIPPVEETGGEKTPGEGEGEAQ